MKTVLLRALDRVGLLRIAYRTYEEIKSVGARLRPRAQAPDGLPVPPPQLIVRVAGTADVGWFLSSGALAAESIRDSLRANGVDVKDLESVLDFGCGCGRVTRTWRDVPAAIYGTDYNERAIEWCRKNLPFARFDRNELAPPLAHGDETFDFAYGLSVFTHLPEDLQLAWLDELARVVKGGGHLLLTVHGKPYVNGLTEEERRRFLAGELVVRRGTVAGSNLCSSFHPPEYVRNRFSTRFDVLDFVEAGAKGNPRQDLYLFRKSAA